MELPPFLVEFLQALAAGLTVGGAYALMCIGLGIIFGSMRVINFAQGDFLMLGMYIAFYLTTGYGILSFLGPYGGPIIAAFLAGPVVFAIGWLLHRFIVSRVTGAGGRRVGGRRRLRADYRHIGALADHAERRFDPLRIDADGNPYAVVAQLV
jgi:branched-subunit amino acid transport system permease